MPNAAPVEVFYVVRTTAAEGERNHCLSSALYETRLQAQSELDRRQGEDGSASYSVWSSQTYVEPAEWRHRVVRADGTMIVPRLHGTTRLDRNC
jgi:hypothetical protein